MTLKFLRDWPGHLPGSVTDQITFGVAQQLVRRGIAIQVKEKAITTPVKHKMIKEKVLTK